MTKIHIAYDKAKSQFVVSCPFHANDLVMGLPSRRWNKTKRAWTAPCIRQNVTYLSEYLLPVSDVDDDARRAMDGALGAIQAGASGDTWPAWYQFKMPPRPYQQAGLNKVYGLKGSALFMDMGTGKTKQAIDTACALRMEDKIKIVLVICKLTLTPNWVAEFKKHASIEYDIFLPKTPRSPAVDKWMGEELDFKIMVIGTESLSQGRMFETAQRFLLSSTKAMVILDESHDIANHKAVRSERVVELGRMAEYRMALTGTPIMDGPMNLYMQFEFLDPNVIGIGDFYAFRNRYAVMGGWRDAKGRPMNIVGYQNLDELMALVGPYIFQVRKSEVLTELPPKRFKKHYVELLPEQKALIKELKHSKKYEWDHRGDSQEVVMKNVLELALRLHQIVGGHVATRDKRSKFDKLTMEELFVDVTEMHEVIPPGKNPKVQETVAIIKETQVSTVVWAVYRPELMAIRQELIRADVPASHIGEIHGGVDEDERYAVLEKFQRGEIKYLLTNQQTGGTGYNMTAAELCIYYNNTFSMTARAQSEDRAHRIGQTNSVLYIDLVAEKTIDEVVLAAIDQKMNLSEYIRGKFSLVTDD